LSLYFVVQDEDVDDADGSPVDGILANQHQDMCNTLPAEGLAYVDAYAGDNLVTPPCKVHTIPHCNNYQVAYYVIVSKFSASDLEGMEVKIHMVWTFTVHGEQS
jgi:hypothetical protein